MYDFYEINWEPFGKKETLRNWGILTGGPISENLGVSEEGPVLSKGGALLAPDPSRWDPFPATARTGRHPPCQNISPRILASTP